ncbi:GNAT family N-acetyltransferase [Acetobacteraceae bacterium H6797]|nr:GNAT family N-acetyltransferase [Acetobacteraceae bacterium H6797]
MPDVTAAPLFSFRPARPEEFEAVLDLSVRTMQPHLERLGRWNPALRRQRIGEAYATGQLRVIESPGVEPWAGTVGAWANVVDGRERYEIHYFYLEPALQGRGFGSAVLDALLAERPDLPCWLEVLRESPAARFYERKGFVKIGEVGVDVLYERPASVSQQDETPVR